jgi:hypothetical protein
MHDLFYLFWLMVSAILRYAWVGFLTINVCFAQSIIGKWKSIDDSSGEARSVVEITSRNGKVYGKVIKVFPAPGEDPDPVCNKCSTEDIRFNK